MLIEVKNLTHIYSEGMSFEATALQDISFTAKQGEFVALIGHTGSGKSTLVQHLNGLLRPTSGSVLADGIDISGKGKDIMAMRHKIGMVFQYPEYQLFEETVLKDVCFGPKRLGISEKEAILRSKEALRIVGVDPEEKGEASPFSLSGGEKRRVAIAGVIAMQPEVLILDEPTAGLDPVGHRDILDMIMKLKEDRNLTIFFVSHNMADVANLADHVIVLNDGKVVMDGSPREVFSREEELRKIGLSVPEAASFAKRLGLEALTVDELVEKIWQSKTSL